MKYASKTEVSVEKSRMEIEQILGRYGANKFAYFSEEQRAMVAFEIAGKRIRFIVRLPDKADDEFQFTNKFRNRRPQAAIDKSWSQACRQSWRALAIIIKAKLEWVSSGQVTIEEEFLSNIVLPTGKTVAETLIPELNQLYQSGRIPKLLPEATA